MTKLFEIIFPVRWPYLDCANILCRYQGPNLWCKMLRGNRGGWHAVVLEGKP